MCDENDGESQGMVRGCGTGTHTSGKKEREKRIMVGLIQVIIYIVF